MIFAEQKLIILSAWVATVAIAGVILAIDKPDLWILIACLALIPAALGTWLWQTPKPALAQAIPTPRSRS